MGMSLDTLAEDQCITVQLHDESTGRPLPLLVLHPVRLDGLSRERVLLSVERLVGQRYGPGVVVHLLTDDLGENDPAFVVTYAGQVLARGGMEVGGG